MMTNHDRDDAMVPVWHHHKSNSDSTLIRWIRDERRVSQIANFIINRLSTVTTAILIETLRWLFQGWRLGSIITFLKIVNPHLHDQKLIVIQGTIKGWPAPLQVRLLEELRLSNMVNNILPHCPTLVPPICLPLNNDDGDNTMATMIIGCHSQLLIN